MALTEKARSVGTCAHKQPFGDQKYTAPLPVQIAKRGWYGCQHSIRTDEICCITTANLNFVTSQIQTELDMLSFLVATYLKACEESSEYAHVSGNEVACYRTERTTMELTAVCGGPVHSISVFELTPQKNRRKESGSG